MIYMSGTPIYSFIAYSGTGKTTLLEKLIAEFKSRELRVAAIKHDAHDFDIDHEGKDSWRFTRAGADITVITSAAKTAIMENRTVTLEALLGKITDVDVILTEGYKSGTWPKIAVKRRATGKPFPPEAESFFAVVTDSAEETDSPCFAIDDVSGLADFIIADIKRRANTGADTR